jgi:hypothetical protein
MLGRGMAQPSQHGSPDTIPGLSYVITVALDKVFVWALPFPFVCFSTNVLYPYLIYLLPMIYEVILLSKKNLTISKKHRWQESEDDILHRMSM